MSTTNERRHKRELQRLKEKIHKQFIERIKGKTEEQIFQYMEQIRIKYGIEYKVQDGQPNN